MEMQFPQTENAGLVQLWEQIFPELEKLHAYRQQVMDLQPPTQGRISEFLATSDDPFVVQNFGKIRELENRIASIKQELENYAVKQLSNPGTQDERTAARKRFNSCKSHVQMMITSLASVASYYEDEEVIKFCNNLMESLPTISNPNRSSNTEFKAAREWLRENHPELNVGRRGKIPEEYLNLYYNRNKS